MRVYHLYREADLAVRKRRKAEYPSVRRQPLEAAHASHNFEYQHCPVRRRSPFLGCPRLRGRHGACSLTKNPNMALE